MKTHISKTILTAAGLFAAALPINSLFAQQTGSSVLIDGVRYVPVMAAGPAVIAPAGGGGAVELPKTPRTPNLFLEAGAFYIKESFRWNENDPEDIFDDSEDSELSGLNKIAGGSLSFGWRINKTHKIQLEVGFGSSSTTNYYSHYDDTPMTDSDMGITKIDMAVMPVLFSYSYCIQLGQANRYQIRVSPVIGFYNMQFKAKITDVYEGRYYEDPTFKKSGAPFAYGIGVGFTYNISKMFYVDAGYRFLRRGGMDLIKEDDYSMELKSANTHWLTACVGWKF